MDGIKKDVKLYSVGLICLAVLDVLVLIGILATTGFDTALLAKVTGRGTGYAFTMIVITIAVNMIAAAMKVKLGLKGFSQLKTYTSNKHLTEALVLMGILAVAFVLSIVTFASGFYGMLTAFTSAFGIYWTFKFRSWSKYYLEVRDAANQIESPVEEVEAEELEEDEAIDFDVEVVEDEDK